MWSRKELKTKAKKTLKKNYIAIVTACFVIALLAGGYNYSTSSIWERSNNYKEIIETNESPREYVNKLVSDIFDKITPDKETAYAGVIGSLVNNITGNSSPFPKVLKFVYNYIATNNTAFLVIITVGIILNIMYIFLIKNILKVGEKRFLLESRLYYDTKASRLLYLYKEKKYANVIKVMFYRDLFQSLWNLTIIGGIIKSYSYRMIPFLLAENSNISTKDAFKISKEMMQGNKWDAFILDLSFIGWDILTILSFGLLGYFFVNPYQALTEAEMYIVLRREYIKNKKESYQLLSDNYIESAPKKDLKKDELDFYPSLDNKLETFEKNANIKYSIVNLVLLFFTFVIVGWIYEVLFRFARHGDFVNPGGFYGPWLPLYGVGGISAIVLLKKYYKNPIFVFIAMMVVAGTIEYFTGYTTEFFKGYRYWDYSSHFLNLNGHICLEGLLVFGLGGAAGLYFVAPYFNNIFNKIRKDYKIIVATILILLFIIDAIYSYFNPHMGEGITIGAGLLLPLLSKINVVKNKK